MRATVEALRVRLVRWALSSVEDAHVYGGGALVAYGLASIDRPLGFIAFGVLLVYLGLRRAT